MRIHTAPFVLAFKLGPKLFAVAGKLLKAAKVGKVGLAGASAVTYAWLFSWEFAAVILVTLVIHEYGHVLAMKSFGIPTKGIYLIPFVGGVAVSEKGLGNRWQEQNIALAGPIFGLAQAFVIYLVYAATGHPLAAAIAGWVALLNLFNLLPITPLDGGRVMKSAAFSIHSGLGTAFLVLGVALSAALLYYLKFWLIGLILVFSIFDLLSERKRNKSELEGMNLTEVLASLGVYAATIAFLVYIMIATAEVPEAALALELLRDS
ncbi:MAG: site-2 protease family protein [Rhodospirillales bacterium]|nr:site-2 protease family protein [Rhodospirillales bacterium]